MRRTSRGQLFIKFAVAAMCFASQYLHATEFIVVQLPHEWIIGADSKESATRAYGGSHTVNKILYVGRFVVLRYGVDGGLGDENFDLDVAIKDALKEKTTEAGAYGALKQLFNETEQRMVEQHKRNKLTNKPENHVMTDDVFAQTYGIGFVLLSVDNGKPLIEDYHLVPQPDLKINWGTSRTILKARELYKPAIFSIPDVLSYTPESSVRTAPVKVVRQLLREMGDRPEFSFGIGPPYVVTRFDGTSLQYVDDSGKSWSARLDLYQ
jgi:hypothetical protein